MNTCNSVSDEIALLDRNHPNSNLQIITSTPSFLSLSYHRSSNPQATTIKFTLNFPSDYPQPGSEVIFVINTDPSTNSVVPPGLKRKLEKDVVQDLPFLVGEYEQVGSVVGKLVKFVDTNKFLSCWKELKQCVHLILHGDDDDEEKEKEDATLNTNTNTKTKTDAITATPKSNYESTIQAYELKGSIKLNLRCGLYHYCVIITLNDAYPTTTKNTEWGKPITLDVQSTNFPPKIETILTIQARDLIRRMQDGMPRTEAFRLSNPMKIPRHLEQSFLDAHAARNKTDVRVRLTNDTLRNLKTDITTLSRVRDLRHVDAAVSTHNARIKANDARQRKDARRAVRKITDAEVARDAACDAKEKAWQMEEAKRTAGYDVSEHDGSNPHPCLLAAVTFLRDMVQRLPREVCPVCRGVTLPEGPENLKGMYVGGGKEGTEEERRARRVLRAARPMRTHCGCWYHHRCLNTFMTEPPFGEACLTAGCGRRVYHPDWPDDGNQLERTWARKMARKREMEDAALF